MTDNEEEYVSTVFILFQEEMQGALGLFVTKELMESFIDEHANEGYYYEEVNVEDVHEYI